MKIDPKLSVAESSLDPEVSCSSLIQLICEKLDNQQPIRRIQLNKKIPSFTSKETKDLMQMRDQALSKDRITAHKDEFCQHRTLKNLCHKRLSRDKRTAIQKQFTQAQGDPRKQWQITKENLGWHKNLTPNTLCHEGKTRYGPHDYDSDDKMTTKKIVVKCVVKYVVKCVVKLKFFRIGTNICVVVDMDPLIMIVVKRQKDKKKTKRQKIQKSNFE